MQYDIISATLEELSLSGAVSLGNRSPSSYYRCARLINERLSFEHANWRAKAKPKEQLIEAVMC